MIGAYMIHIKQMIRIAMHTEDYGFKCGIQKNWAARLSDLIKWRINKREVNTFYYAFGMDYKDTQEIDEYLSIQENRRLREAVNSRLVTSESPLNYRVITGDKFISNNYMKSSGINCVPNRALIYQNKVYWDDGEIDVPSAIKSRGDKCWFVKNVTEHSGNDVYKLEIHNDQLVLNGNQILVERLERLLKDKIWVLQDRVSQHTDLSAFNESAVHCLRVNTILENRIPVFFSSFMKIATQQTHVDNWDSGSVLVKVIHEKGVLDSQGYFKPGSGRKGTCLEHPVSHIKFYAYPIPFYHEAVDLCLKAHIYFYGRVIVGWDVIITDEGPVILEANCYPLIHPQQMLFGGLRGKLQKHYGSNL